MYRKSFLIFSGTCINSVKKRNRKIKFSTYFYQQNLHGKNLCLFCLKKKWNENKFNFSNTFYYKTIDGFNKYFALQYGNIGAPTEVLNAKRIQDIANEKIQNEPCP